LALITIEPAEGVNKKLRILEDEARESKTKEWAEPYASKLHVGDREEKRESYGS